MSTKTTEAKAKVLGVVTQAKQSLKALEGMVRLPDFSNRKKITNEKILAGLKAVGVASQGELESLKKRVAKLEAELKAPKDSALS